MNWDGIKGFLTTAGVDLLRGLIALAVGLFLVHWVMKLFERYEPKMKIEPTLRGFIKNLVRILLYVVVVMTAANTMGIPMTSLVTLLGSAGVAVSLAMQGVLGNLIGGFILLLFKPIRVGEYVKIGDNEGTVKVIGAFYTEIATFDNRHVNLPNGALTNTPIVNFTREGTRRLDLTFSVSYDSDLDRVYEVLNGVVAEEKALLPDPASLGPLTKGKTCIGCLLQGSKDGKPVKRFVYNVCDHEESFRETGAQAVSYTTGVPAMIGAMMLATGTWKGPGVFNMEEFDPAPFMQKLNEYGLPWEEIVY